MARKQLASQQKCVAMHGVACPPSISTGHPAWVLRSSSFDSPILVLFMVSAHLRVKTGSAAAYACTSKILCLGRRL